MESATQVKILDGVYASLNTNNLDKVNYLFVLRARLVTLPKLNNPIYPTIYLLLEVEQIDHAFFKTSARSQIRTVSTRIGTQVADIISYNMCTYSHTSRM